MDTRLRVRDRTVLIVEDHPVNQELLSRWVERAGYRPIVAEDAEAALQRIDEHAHGFDVVLLVRMLPGMDGVDLLRQLKSDERFASLPVIMQTALADKADVIEGLRAGAYHYLTKPLQCDSLIAILETAVADYRRYREILEEVQSMTSTAGMLRSGVFVCRTLEECRRLATFLANACPEPNRVALGLSELLVNAVEHGNLQISYDDKSALIADATWSDEVERRLALPEYASKVVTVGVDAGDSEVQYLIKDEGSGFNWQDFLEVDPSRLFDCHGRGIAMAAHASFDKVKYYGTGSEVAATVVFDRAEQWQPDDAVARNESEEEIHA